MYSMIRFSYWELHFTTKFSSCGSQGHFNLIGNWETGLLDRLGFRQTSPWQRAPTPQFLKPVFNRELMSAFEEGTTETEWSPSGEGPQYILRHVHGETCCDAPWDGMPDWPIIRHLRQEEGEPDYTYVLAVIAGLWVKDSGRFVAFWGSDEGDGHVDFYCRDDFEDISALEPLSGILSTELCPPLIDVFDDGSGKDRDPIAIPSSEFTNELLNNLYSSKSTLKRTRADSEPESESRNKRDSVTKCAKEEEDANV